MKIFGIGRNFGKHALELGNDLPSSPVVFQMQDTALLIKNRPFYIPDFTKHVDHEIELVVRIDREGKNVQEKFAHKYYSQIGLGVDFTARDLQNELKEKGLPWCIAKGFNHSAPISNFIAVPDDINDINFHLDINGQTVQKGNSSEMIFNINQLITYVSKYFVLKKGDLIYTGTPAGVGKINIGDKLEGYLENQKLLDFEIR